MELWTTADIYSPGIDSTGKYADVIPTAQAFVQGIRCPCGTRKDHIYYTRSGFSIHTSSKTHAKWIADINANRDNHVTENIRLKELVETQELLIAAISKESTQRLLLVESLLRKLEDQSAAHTRELAKSSTDLLLFD